MCQVRSSSELWPSSPPPCRSSSPATCSLLKAVPWGSMWSVFLSTTSSRMGSERGPDTLNESRLMFEFEDVPVCASAGLPTVQHCFQHSALRQMFFLQGSYVLLALGPGAPLADLCPRCGGLWGLAFERWTRDSAEEPCLGLCLYGWGCTWMCRAPKLTLVYKDG